MVRKEKSSVCETISQEISEKYYLGKKVAKKTMALNSFLFIPDRHFERKNPMSRQYTYEKRQTNNFTKSRLDLFLLNNNSKEIVRKVGIGWVSTLSDHRPIYIHSMLSRVQR